MNDQALREELIETCIAMNASGINRGTSGNISVRTADDTFLMTPSGIAYLEMTPDQIVPMLTDGAYEGDWKPSTEWRMHADIYAEKPEAGAVLHCHAPHATALSCLRMDVPAFHYMIGVTGAKIIRCAKYELFGTKELSVAMMAAFGDGNTCLLANHGFTCFSKDLKSVLKLGIEIENLCQQYVLALSAGKPFVLTDAEMDEALAAFKTYGNQPKTKAKKATGKA
ncbi:MAG: class II aldolase/adducin family protein [Pseudomonadota bacterium]